MSVNPINAAATQPASAGTGTERARPASPPPPPGANPANGPEAGGFVSAIGQALQALGVTEVAASDRESASRALGSFLEELMASLQEQGEAKGGGGLAQDLQSLADATTGQDASLQASFASLLESLGVDSSDAEGKLDTFLRALAGQVPQSGSSGNLVNTTA